jgi:hypothetical protein
MWWRAVFNYYDEHPPTDVVRAAMMAVGPADAYR